MWPIVSLRWPLPTLCWPIVSLSILRLPLVVVTPCLPWPFPWASQQHQISNLSHQTPIIKIELLHLGRFLFFSMTACCAILAWMAIHWSQLLHSLYCSWLPSAPSSTPRGDISRQRGAIQGPTDQPRRGGEAGTIRNNLLRSPHLLPPFFVTLHSSVCEWQPVSPAWEG